jgi:hypothetical protein
MPCPGKESALFENPRNEILHMDVVTNNLTFLNDRLGVS